ncbi:MAG: sigma-70 family RNA polymerase sigma factor [Verrucomicrobiota bacterium]
MSSPDSDFIRLWTAHQRDLERYVLSLAPRPQDASEILQETAASLWAKWAGYDAEQPFLPWAVRFAYFEVLQWRQRQARDRLVFSDSLVDSLHADYLQEAPLMEARRRALDGCLAKLDAPEQSLLFQRYARHGTVKDLASGSGGKVNALYYKLEKLRSALLDCIERRLRHEGWTEA